MVAAAEPLVVADADADGVVVACAVTGGITSGRKFRLAAWPSLLMSWVFLPGIETTIWLLPWITTSASVTPEPLTRSSMICRASLIADFDGALPLGAFASKMTCLPPSRSRPSLGVCR